MAFKGTLAEMLIEMLKEKADITPKHKYYKTVCQEDRFRADLIWIILKWMDKCNIKIDLKI